MGNDQAATIGETGKTVVKASADFVEQEKEDVSVDDEKLLEFEALR